MAFTTVDNPELYLQAKTYSGNGSTNAITFDGSENMQPDWLWLKTRSNAVGSNIFDVLRGTNSLHSDTAGAQADRASDGFTSLDSDGFTLNGSGSGGSINVSGRTYVGWGWKAGSSVSGNTTGSGTAKSYTGSVNTTAGFSIISFTGNGTSGHTIPHNLGVAPAWVIVKRYDDSNNWRVGHNGLTSWEYRLTLETNDAQGSQSAVFNSTAPTSSVVTLGNSGSANGNGNTYIMYSFADIKGYSKFGKYTGNANVDGPMIYTGFRPSYVLIKNAAASEHWRIYDNKRDTFNHMYHVLFANEASAESTVDNASEEIDFLSNGIKIRSSAQQLNGSGQNLVYMAFAESPFVNSSGVPNNGR